MAMTNRLLKKRLLALTSVACLTACFSISNGIASDGPRLPEWTQKAPLRQIWDGDGTDAKSGVERQPLFDPGNTDWQSGLKPTPQTYWRPETPLSDDVDPDEFKDATTGKWRAMDWSPYALLQLTFPINYKGRTLTRGFYLVKAGSELSGSVNQQVFTSLSIVPDANQPSPAPLKPLPKVSPRRIKWLGPLPFNTTPAPHAPYRVLVLKQRGVVMAVLPIKAVSVYQPHPKEKLPKQPVAWVATSPVQNTLYFYEQQRLYSLPF
jgi:hypothetical protein